VQPLVATKIPITTKATRTLEIKEGEGGRLGREEEGVGIEVAEAEDEAIQVMVEEEVSHVMIMRTQGSKRTTPRINYQLISVPSAARRATIRPTVVCIRSSKRKSFKSRKPKEKERLKEM
jgi:hypothetical protein